MTGTIPEVNCRTLGWSLPLSQPPFPSEAKRMAVPTLSEDEINAFITEIASKHPVPGPLLGAGGSAVDKA